MAGPSSSVLVRFEGVPPTWRDVLSPFACEWPGDNFCYINSTKAYGGTYNDVVRPFVGSIHAFSEESGMHSEPEVNAIEAITKRTLTHSIGLAAMCNREFDHKILGELSAAIAERFDGVVNFDLLDAPIDALGLAKRVWVEDGDEYWTVLGSAAAARNWLAHERFHMLK